MRFVILLGYLSIVRAYPRGEVSFDHKEAIESLNTYQLPHEHLQSLGDISSIFRSNVPIIDLSNVGNEPVTEKILATIIAKEPEVKTKFKPTIKPTINPMIQPTKQPNFSNINPSKPTDIAELQAILGGIYWPGIQIVDVVQALEYHPGGISHQTLNDDELPTIIDNKKTFLKPNP